MGTKNELKRRSIVKDINAKSIVYFEKICPDFYSITYKYPSDYVASLWNAYKVLKIKDNAINGKVFEFIIVTLLIREEIFPFYYQAELSFVNTVKFDIFLWSEDGRPFTLSVKTSLRERYKQAVLEADKIISTHPRSENILISLDENEILKAQKDIKNKDIRSLESALYADSKQFDKFIYRLKSYDFVPAPTVNLVDKSQAFVRS